MSYSVCLNCETPVYQYEKYCDKCAETYRQDPVFWKIHGYDYYQEPTRTQELLADKAIPWKKKERVNQRG